MAKLTPENRDWIISRWLSGKYTQQELADSSGVTPQAVNYILKTHGLTKPPRHKNKCLACGTKMRWWHWENYPICGDQLCAQAYGEASKCKPRDPLRIHIVQQHFWAPIQDWMEIHYKGAGYHEHIKEYSLFHSQREHVGYHWELLEKGVFKVSDKTSSRVLRPTNMKPIWDGVENYEGERKFYVPASHK
jgi:hypothetical protein